MPLRLLIIRHAEEHATTGVTEDGTPDPHSLTPRGWQRAGALVHRFGPGSRSDMIPDAIYSSSIAPGSESRRPQQTVTPLLALLSAGNGVASETSLGKHDTEPLASSVMQRSGTVLIAWEHSKIADFVRALPNPPEIPEKWPSDRYDLIWVLDRDGDGWRFHQEPQLLLAGDEEV